MRHGGGAWDQQDVGGALEEPGQSHDHGGDAQLQGRIVQDGGLQRRKAAQGEVRDIGDAVPGEVIDDGVVRPVRDVIQVLHTDDVAEPASFGHLRGGDVAEADVTYEALALQLGEDGKRLLDGAFGWYRRAEHDAEVDDVERVQTQIAKVVVDGLRQLLDRESRVPGTIVATAGTYLGDDGYVFGVGVQGLLDDLVGDVRSVEVAGVDVVDSEFDGFAEDGERGIHVPGGAEDVRAGELHGAVAHAIDGEGGSGEGEGAAEVGLCVHLYLQKGDRNWMKEARLSI